MAKRYLVTGGTGFIGSALVQRLVAEGRHVRVVDNDLRGRRARLADLEREIEFIDADVRDEAAMTAAATGIDAILHLAAINGTENFYARPDLVLDVGVRGMLAMLAAARARHVPEFILVSSSEVYQTPPVVPTPEDVPLTIPDPWNPRYSYAGGKLVSEIMLANYDRGLFERAIIVRPHNVYGPDMGWEHVLPQLILRAQERIAATPRGEVSIELQGDGSQTRAFVHFQDFVDGFMLAADKGAHRMIYNIGTDDEVAIAGLVEMIFDRLGRRPRLVPLPLPAGGTLRRCPDISRLRGLGYGPRRGLREGIDEMIAWYTANAHLRPAA